jgi:hypothetical protein
VDAEPLSGDYVEKMFTTAGAGTNNMVDYFDRMSHGTSSSRGAPRWPTA